ncbi:Hypothetical_protein [Hexamita inflata]|uniref:Hypothetical_protein n=1 Tax=Hexamita inflata TaxID=28002 RepID=A0AA86N7C8_9EUKA|nr:Hypothetical protein HINF_LOCUS1748 [Hexamita inflata]
MSSCPCYKSKFQFDESLTIEHLLVNIHNHNSGIVVASKLEEISQKLVLGWVQFRAVPEVVFSYGEFFQQRNTIKEVINKQNKTKYFSRFHSLLITALIFTIIQQKYLIDLQYKVTRFLYAICSKNRWQMNVTSHYLVVFVQKPLEFVENIQIIYSTEQYSFFIFSLAYNNIIYTVVGPRNAFLNQEEE